MKFGIVLVVIALFYNDCVSMLEQEQPSGEIKDFVHFLEESLQRKVLNYSINPLTKPGDNFGAILQSVDVKVGNDTKQEETVHLVVKTAVTKADLVAIFQPDITFIKETVFYSEIIPAFEQFEETQNVPEADRLDVFIPCVGFRISLNSSAELADADAAMLLENIKYQNYTNGDRHVGMNTEDTVVVMKNLAKFHATAIAMRRLQPALYDTKVKPYLDPISINTSGDEKIDILSKDLKHVKGLTPELRATIKESMKLGKDFYGNPANASITPYTTIVHEDMWINNVMMKKDSTQMANLTRIKIYDFQMYFYESFVHDMIFFLFTSVQPDHLTPNFKLFIDHYHMEFTRTLTLLKCPLDDYQFEKMWKEIQKRAKFELYRLMYRTELILGTNDGAESSTPEKVVVDKWTIIIDLFRENGFL